MDWSGETILLVLAVGGVIIFGVIIFAYLAWTSPAVQDRLDGLRRTLRKIFKGRKGGAGSAGSNSRQADEDRLPSNPAGIERHFEKVENRLSWCEYHIQLLRGATGNVKGSGGANFNENDVRRVVYDLISENPGEIKRLLGISASGGRPQREPEVPRSESHVVQPSPAQATAERRTMSASRDQSDSVTSTRAYLDLCRQYNAGVGDQVARSEFKLKYAPVTISVVNAVERRRDVNLPPEFQTASEGNFLAVRLDHAGRYAVFPKFNLVLGEASHGSGAIGEVFRCPDFNPRFNYPNITVEAPAIFVSKNGDVWEKVTVGVLCLGEAQQV